MKNLKKNLIGLIRVRNEELILKDTLDHMATFCKGVYVYDDASEDDTNAIATSHPIVKVVLRENRWDKNQVNVQARQRRELFEFAKKECGEDQYYIYMDADERILWDFDIEDDTDGVRMMLFNAIITEDDYKPYDGTRPLMDFRRWFDPSFREILMVFSGKLAFDGQIACEREPTRIPDGAKIRTHGYVQHYGRAVSCMQFVDTCHHYINNVPLFADKWKAELEEGAVKSSEGLVSWNDCITRNKGDSKT